jgi:nitronate monooxygenase
LRAYGSIAATYPDARARNDLDIVPVVCGEAVGLLKDRPSAESILNAMIREAEAALRRGGNLDFASA